MKTLKKLAMGLAVFSPLALFASTDAVDIATNASDAFAIVAPITITIAGFYVILHLAKRVVK